MINPYSLTVRKNNLKMNHYVKDWPCQILEFIGMKKVLFLKNKQWDKVSNKLLPEKQTRIQTE